MTVENGDVKNATGNHFVPMAGFNQDVGNAVGPPFASTTSLNFRVNHAAGPVFALTAVRNSNAETVIKIKSVSIKSPTAIARSARRCCQGGIPSAIEHPQIILNLIKFRARRNEAIWMIPIFFGPLSS